VLAVGAGTSHLSATITPSTDLEMPLWEGTITVVR
jgi:hypothetical protein